MRHVLSCAFAIGLGISIVGCGPTVSHSDLGTIVYEVPNIPGAEEPYRLPDLPPPPPGSSPRSRMPVMPPTQPPNASDSQPVSEQAR
jgi:hypothetical protein